MSIHTHVHSTAPIAIHPIVVGPLMRGTVSLCVAMPGVGKSTWAQSAAMAIAHEAPQIIGEGKPATPLWPGPVVLLSAEDDKRIVTSKLSTTAAHHQLPLASRHQVGTYSMVGKKLFRLKPGSTSIVEFIGDDFLEDLCDFMESPRDLALVVFDTLSACLQGINESNPEQMQQVMDEFIRISKSAFCSVLLIHHASKVAASSNDSLTLYAGRGSSVVPASVRSVFTLAKPSKEEAKALLAAGTDPKPLVKMETVKASYVDPTTWKPRWFRFIGLDQPAFDPRDSSSHRMSVGVLEPMTVQISSPVSNQSPMSAFGTPETRARRVWPVLENVLNAGPAWALNTTPKDKKDTNAKEIFGLSAEETNEVLEVLKRWGLIRIPNKEKKEIFRVAGVKLPEIEPEFDRSSTGVETEVEPE